MLARHIMMQMDNRIRSKHTRSHNRLSKKIRSPRHKTKRKPKTPKQRKLNRKRKQAPKNNYPIMRKSKVQNLPELKVQKVKQKINQSIIILFNHIWYLSMKIN